MTKTPTTPKTAKMEQVTVEKLLTLLQELVKKNPAAASWPITTIEFGGATPLYNINIDEEDKEVVIGSIY